MVNPRSSSSYRLLRSRFLIPPSIFRLALILQVFSLFVFLLSQRPCRIRSGSLAPTGVIGFGRATLGFCFWLCRYGHRPCLKPTRKYSALQNQKHYITVRSNGGLNQMRTGICDMVDVARMMNAVLVIPQLDERSFWQDTSTFYDIFDESHFIKALETDVHIVSELPKEMESAPRARKHFTSWSSASYYEEMTQMWKDYEVIHIPKSDSRLANNDLPVDIQRLRCRAMYHALCFSNPIESHGKVLRLHAADTTEASGVTQVTWSIYRASFAS